MQVEHSCEGTVCSELNLGHGPDSFLGVWREQRRGGEQGGWIIVLITTILPEVRQFSVDPLLRLRLVSWIKSLS